MKKGTKCKNRKPASKYNFTIDQINKMKQMYKMGITQQKIALKFNCSQAVVNRYINDYYID